MGNAHQHASDSNINVGMGLLINLPKYTDAIAILVPSDKRKRWGPHVSRSPPKASNEDPHVNPLSQEQVSWGNFR